ncbi:hypothetical protein RJ640_016307 [Escallonia rubra]|uniref:Retroviral polymerase SH3-like domain-containing protein n=1 Tax=Escallonia rubra TaxID=112253 RepID=A0AA88RD23_9ASTE|nr:hypothetical protein RJ640_016307 [Escallonia rubra]
MNADDWKEYEAKAMSTILLSLASEVKCSVLKETSPLTIWSKLEKIYMSKSLTNRLYLKKQFYQLHMDDSSNIIDHLNAFSKITTELLNVEVKIDEEDLVIILLSSLPLAYETLRTTLLIGKDTLTVDEVMTTLLETNSLKDLGSGSHSGGLVARANPKIFGCPAYVHVQYEEHSKLDAKSRKCTFLGYKAGVKGYRLWDSVAKKRIAVEIRLVIKEQLMIKTEKNGWQSCLNKEDCRGDSPVEKLEGVISNLFRCGPLFALCSGSNHAGFEEDTLKCDVVLSKVLLQDLAGIEAVLEHSKIHHTPAKIVKPENIIAIISKVSAIGNREHDAKMVHNSRPHNSLEH